MITENPRTENTLLDGGAIVEAERALLRGTEDLRTGKNLATGEEAHRKEISRLTGAIDMMASILIDTGEVYNQRL